MRARLPFRLAAVVALVAGAAAALAQIEGDTRGVAPVASSTDFQVDDVAVDVSGKTAEEARLAGWRLAERRAWTILSKRLGGGGAAVGDATLDGMVTAIVVGDEQIGPTRYIARLGVTFDRQRAGALLGVATFVSRSAPMLVIPVEVTGGAAQVFETRTAWQQAWARYRTGGSTIDYVRPSGAGSDPLLLNAGQVGRRGRGWWRNLLAQYGASNVLAPTVTLYRQWPGGPVVGVFEARHGPDNDLLERVVLRVDNADGLPKLLDTGVARLDDIYSRALREGQLRADPSLSPTPPRMPGTPEPEALAPDEGDPAALAPGEGVQIAVQFDTPGVAAVTAGEAAVRAVPGVRAAITTSLALGGVSVMRVSYAGPADAFRAALEARGFQVFGQGTTLRIRRAPQLLPPDLSADDRPAG
jgi:hypothetical protein